MEVLSHSFHPPVSGLNGEVTSSAHGLEHGGPVSFTVELAIFNMELGAPDRLGALGTEEALGVEALLQGIHTLPNDSLTTLITVRGKHGGVVLLTVQEASLLHEANVQQLDATLWVGTGEVVRAPALAQGSHEGPSDRGVTSGTHRDTS